MRERSDIADIARAPWRLISGIRTDEMLVLQGPPCLGAAFAFAGGTWVSGRVLAAFLLASCALVAHVFALNDWSETVATSRPNPLGRDETRMLWIALLAVALAIFASIGALPLLLASGIALLSALYSAKPSFGKGRPVVGSLLHLVGGALHFLLGYSLRGVPDTRGCLLALFCGLTFAAGHLTQETRDRDDDLRNGARTNAVAFGKVPTFLAGLVLFTTADALLCALALLGFVPLAVAAATAALYPFHFAWSLQALSLGLAPSRVRRLQWKYRALHAAIGIVAAASLVPW